MAPTHRNPTGGDAQFLPWLRTRLACPRARFGAGQEHENKSMKTGLLILVLGGLLAAIVYGTLKDWDASAMSVHGWIALGAGTALSLLVGGGLMALVFYSARKGFDDRTEIDPDAGGSA